MQYFRSYINFVQNITILWIFEILVVKFLTPVACSQLQYLPVSFFFSFLFLFWRQLFWSCALFSFCNYWGGEMIKKFYYFVKYNFIMLKLFCYKISVLQVVLCGPLGFHYRLTGEGNRANESIIIFTLYISVTYRNNLIKGLYFLKTSWPNLSLDKIMYHSF